MKYSYGTTDSYNTSYRTITPEELADKVIEDVKDRRFNRYYGGKTNSISASLDYYRKGFIYKDQMIVYGSRDEIQRFEELIKPYVKYFTPREFN